MNRLGQALKEVSSRLGRKVSQTELGNACDVTQGHVSNLVLGRQHASIELMRRIVKYLSSIDSGFNYTAEYLLESTSESLKNNTNTPIKLGLDMASLPEVAAVPCGRFEDISSNEVKEWHLIPRSLVGSAKIIVKAVGDSMAPMIQPDDLLLVEEVESSAVKTDDVVIVDIDNELGCKRIARNDEAVVLLSDNPAHRPIHVNGGQTVKVVGRVVGLHRKF
tara:strand:- start:71 stop:730 length:660 start_codon:yes stop_codon:yes gene_type:complete